MSAEWKRGDAALWQGAAVEIVEGVYAGNVTLRLIDDPTRTLHQVPQSAVQRAADVRALTLPLTQIDATVWAAACSRADTARRLIGQGGVLTNAAVEEAARKLGLSIRTLRRDLARIKEVDHPATLIPSPGGRPKGHSVIASAVGAIIDAVLEEVYLKENRPSLHEVGEEIRALCRQQGLIPPVDRTIRRRVERKDAYDVLKARKGSKHAKYRLQAMPGSTLFESLMECVEIDHTMADVILRSDDEQRTLLGRPWVTLAIDVRSRMVVGVHVTFDAPSAASVALCLLNVLLPKDAFLAWLRIEAPWPAYGCPGLIYVDNGKDFHSKALIRGCQSIGIDVQYRPVGSPHYGGIIERLIGTMMGKCRLLPGTTHRNVQERGDYDAEAQAVMTLSEFRRWFVSEIVTQYHTREHRALKAPPLVEWRTLSEKYGAPRLLAGQWTAFEVFVAFLPGERRVIQRDGVHVNAIRYWHASLDVWIGDGQDHFVHYDPRDIRYVYLRSPSGQVVRAEAITPGVPEMSLAEWRAHRRERSQLAKDPAILALRDGGLVERRAMIESSTEATRKARIARRAMTSRRQTPPAARWSDDASGTAQQGARPALPMPAVASVPTPSAYDGELWS